MAALIYELRVIIRNMLTYPTEALLKLHERVGYSNCKAPHRKLKLLMPYERVYKTKTKDKNMWIVDTPTIFSQTKKLKHCLICRCTWTLWKMYCKLQIPEKTKAKRIVLNPKNF